MKQKIEYVSIAAIASSKLNPRTSFPEKEIQELAASIKEHGILQPLLVRPDADGYEVIAGARRLKAAAIAELDEIPVIIRKMNDDEAAEVMLVENLQRENVHPMEEALGINRLLDNGFTVNEISSKITKPVGYIQKRIRLLLLNDKAKKQFIEGEIDYNQAIILAKLTEDDQKAAMDKATDGYGSSKRLMSWKDLAEWVESNLMLKFKDAIFKVDDVTLYPEAGSCDACPKRTKNAPGLFDEADKLDRCTDGACFKKKTALYIARKKQETEKKFGAVVTGSIGWDDRSVKVKGQELPILKKQLPGSIPVVITSHNAHGTTKKGKVVFVMEPKAVPAGKSKVDNSKAKEEEKAKARHIRNMFRKIIFKKIFDYLMTRSKPKDGWEDHVRELIWDGLNIDYSSAEDPILVELGLANIKPDELYGDVKLGSQIKTIREQAKQLLLHVDTCSLVLLFMAGGDAEESKWSEASLNTKSELKEAAEWCNIDWNAELKRYQDNLPKPELKKEVAPKANKVAPKANKVTKNSTLSPSKAIAAAKKVNPTPGFMRPMIISEALIPIVGKKPLARTEVVKKVWDYIKKNKLQDAKERRNINADEALKKVFGGQSTVTMFEMTKLINDQLAEAIN